MKSKKNLVLLGMMGSGKSTIGSIVSKKLNINFFDTDKFIEKETNMTIKEIFNEKGESFFRDLEEKTVLKLLQSSNNIISLGGGSFINEKVRNEILTKNFSLWLNWKTSTLINRIKNSKKRPIAFNLKNNELIHLIEKRSKIYEKASFKINCDKMTKTEIVNKILYLYEHN
jgi:shikimate kinase